MLAIIDTSTGCNTSLQGYIGIVCSLGARPPYRAMRNHMGKIDFEVIVDDQFISTKDSAAWKGKNLWLSLMNNFQSGSWRYERFSEFLWDNIQETALSASERELVSSYPMSKLKLAAKNLRFSTDDNKGGEIGEIVLYGILKKHFNALPIVPKIFYKQNTQDYAKGADSVHLVIDKKGTFSIWLGESKFYDDFSTGTMDKAVESLKETLKDNKIRKEFTIVTSLHELNHVCPDETIRNNILATLSDGLSLDEVKHILHVPVLILYGCSYTAKATTMTQEYRSEIETFQREQLEKYFTKQEKELSTLFNYDKITFHIIVFPVPDKSRIVSEFKKTAEDLRQ